MATNEIDNRAAKLARQCGFIPGDSEVLAEIFAGYSFELDGVPMSPAEVFAPEGFLTAIMLLAADKMQDLAGKGFQIKMEDSESSITGIIVRHVGAAAADRATLLMSMAQVSREMFGLAPQLTPIDLAPLYEWMVDDSSPRASVPILYKQEGGESGSLQ